MASIESKIYSRESKPFGKTWEQWAAAWCNWMLSLPKSSHPNLDETGEKCTKYQNDPDVWFLAGTFGNVVPVKRHCKIPSEKSILYCIIEKEDSFAENKDLSKESDLQARAKNFINNVTKVETEIDGQAVKNLQQYRINSDVFDLVFPAEPVYSDVNAGPTRAACDGYWIMLKPMPPGKHEITFKGEVSYVENDIGAEQIRNEVLYSHIKEDMDNNKKFRVDVTYYLEIL